MQQRPLGKTGLHVGIIGMGGIPMMRCSREEGIALYQYAIDRGINYFDAARGYTDCHPRLGAAIQGRRDRVLIATKDGAKTAEAMTAAIDDSLQVLGTDYIDVFKLHGVNQFDDLERRTGPGGALEALLKAKEQGKIRHIGISGHNSDVLIRAVEQYPFEVILVLFNYMNTEPEERLLRVCAERGVGVTVMKPIGGSVLAQHAELALRWVLQHEEVSCACPGMWLKSEIETNVRIGRAFQPLTEAEMEALADQQAMRSPMHCRLCYRHRPCPYGVDLNDMMIADLSYTRFGMAMLMRRGWDKKVEATAHCLTCDSAGECRASCRYGVDIPRYLRHVYATYMPVIEAWRQAHPQSET